MNTKEKVIKKSWDLLNEYLFDENNSNIVKSEIVRKLFKLDKSIDSISLVIERKGIKKTLNLKIRHKRESYPELYLWRKTVLDRDGNKCTKCGSTKNLEAHHIDSWAEFPEKRFILDNGLTLCKKCHCKTMNYGRKYNAFC